MRNLFIAASVATGLATSALAGAVDVVIAEEPAMVEAAAPVVDWSGFYVGGMASSDSGTLEYSNPPGTPPYVEYDYEPNKPYGGFAGYNFQRESIVYGAEVAYNSGGIYAVGFPDEASSHILDLKGRAGFAFGNALIFGVVGYSMIEWTTSDTYSANGLNYGAGLDYLIGQHMFVGAEYLVRDMSGARADDPDQIGHSAVQSAEIRVGWKF